MAAWSFFGRSSTPWNTCQSIKHCIDWQLFHGVLNRPKKNQAAINSACLIIFTTVTSWLFVIGNLPYSGNFCRFRDWLNIHENKICEFSRIHTYIDVSLANIREILSANFHFLTHPQNFLLYTVVYGCKMGARIRLAVLTKETMKFLGCFSTTAAATSEKTHIRQARNWLVRFPFQKYCLNNF